MIRLNQHALVVAQWVAVMALLGAAAPAVWAAGAAVIFRDPASPPVVFAAAEIRKALEGKGYTVTTKPLADWKVGRERLEFVIQVDPRWVGKPRIAVRGTPGPVLGPQAYTIGMSGLIGGGITRSYQAIGTHAAGAMYGGLDLAEKIALHRGPGEIKIIQRTLAPAIPRRGIKFNIPLDARTPSYDDTGDAAQKNIVEMWNFEFWREFLDDMARHRYNTLTLWNPHPFPSIVRLPDYPEVALDDVCVSKLKPDRRTGRDWNRQYWQPENFKVVKKIAFDEKIAFWRRVMKHARDRGIGIYFITWNVYVNGAEGKYGITHAQDNPKTIGYLRQCVRETIRTYPLLAGLGLTAGERMRHRKDEFAKEKWLWRAYGEGVLDAKKLLPGRSVPFIHRYWQSGVGAIVDDFGAKYPDRFELSFKYARAHMYSSTRPPFADKLVQDLKRHKLRCWWNLRNDDIFNFRWGDPDYVRAFLKNLPARQVTAGYHMGSDGYVWAREHTSTEPEKPRQLEIRKHWYNFMLWGRLGYDPTLGRAFFEKVIAARLGGADAGKLYGAWQAASKIIPQVNRFHWRNWDFMWAVEICSDSGKGFHTVNDFISCETMAASGLVSIKEYVAQRMALRDGSMSPLEVADRLDAWAAAALRAAMTARPRRAVLGKELRLTLADIEAMCHLGHYYAAKIRGAVALEKFRKGHGADRQAEAVKHLTGALGHWKRYAETASKHYNPQLLARTRRTDWNKITEHVANDVTIARSAK